jgi:hypothetical protein
MFLSARNGRNELDWALTWYTLVHKTRVQLKMKVA